MADVFNLFDSRPTVFVKRFHDPCKMSTLSAIEEKKALATSFE